MLDGLIGPICDEKPCDKVFRLINGFSLQVSGAMLVIERGLLNSQSLILGGSTGGDFSKMNKSLLFWGTRPQ